MRYLLIVPLCLGAAHAGELSLFVGQDFSDGNYGAESESRIGVSSFGGRLRLGDWSLRASTGYIDLGEDPDTVIAGPRGRELTLNDGEDVQGFTDLNIGVSGLLHDEGDRLPAISLSLSAKLPTADESKGLGTGAADFGGSVEFSKSFGDTIGFVYIGGKIRGESDVTPVSDSLSAGFGAQRAFSPKWMGSLSYDYRGASFEDGEEAQEVTALIGYQASPSTNISVYVYSGLTNVSPSLGGGVFVNQRVLRW